MWTFYAIPSKIIDFEITATHFGVWLGNTSFFSDIWIFHEIATNIFSKLTPKPDEKFGGANMSYLYRSANFLQFLAAKKYFTN